MFLLIIYTNKHVKGTPKLAKNKVNELSLILKTSDTVCLDDLMPINIEV